MQKNYCIFNNTKTNKETANTNEAVLSGILLSPQKGFAINRGADCRFSLISL